MKDQNLHNDEVYLAQWLDGTISDQELKKLVSETDYVAYQKLKHGIHAYEQLESPVDASFDRITSRMQQRKKPSNRYLNWSVAIAASVILCFGLFSIFGNDMVSIQTDFGEQKTVALLDGSEVILNSKSEISYDSELWQNKRELFLKGEAYFKVKKGSTFTVNTENGKVTVLGTQFNVNSISDYFQVVCFEGKVAVNTSDGLNILTPNDNIRKINGDALETWQVKAEQPSWLNGESSFKSVPIKYVIDALEAQYNVSFDTSGIDDSVIFTGSFSHSNLNTALKTVFETLGITYFEKENKSIELSLD